MYYFDPSGARFRSKIGVMRHLRQLAGGASEVMGSSSEAKAWPQAKQQQQQHATQPLATQSAPSQVTQAVAVAMPTPQPTAPVPEPDDGVDWASFTDPPWTRLADALATVNRSLLPRRVISMPLGFPIPFSVSRSGIPFGYPVEVSQWGIPFGCLSVLAPCGRESVCA